MIGLGIDLCAIARAERLLAKDGGFLRRYFTEDEQAYLKARGNMAAQSLAAMFAAKEALLKAMGLGLGSGVELRDISVSHDQNGRPFYTLTGKAAEKMAAMGAKEALVSLTHEDGMAAAMAVIQ
ncbi:MAG: holo-ACP synthase [Clostridia bacterium]|nr:holo-ACP synthase [Clostridia bacterium]